VSASRRGRHFSALVLEHARYAQWQIPFRGPEAPELNTPTVLGGLGRVNAFVGANNSGKSRLMRALAMQSVHEGDLEWAADDVPGTAALRRRYEALRVELLRRGVDGLKVKPPGLEWSAHDPSRDLLFREPQAGLSAPEAARFPRPFAKQLAEIGHALADGGSIAWVSLVEEERGFRKRVEKELADIGTGLADDQLHERGYTRVYIPVLRGLRPVARDGENSFAMDDRYAQRTVHDYFGALQKDQAAPTVFTGLGLYDELRKGLLGTHAQREAVRDYEDFLSTQLFDAEVTLTPRHDSDQVFIKLGAAKEYAVSQLGDGLQQALLLTWPLFAHERAMIFIEEPELYLHPGLLRRVLRYYLTGNHDHLIFCTTHSNHLLELSWDYEGLSVYSFKPKSPRKPEEPSFSVQQLSAGDPHSLALLGVRTSSVFLVNATIWVEGITDRLYLRKLLELYRAHRAAAASAHTTRGDASTPDPLPGLREDRDYAFVEYGGASVTHLAAAAPEGKRDGAIRPEVICGRMILVADSDGHEKPHVKHLRASLGARFLQTPGREIENLLPPAVLRHVVESYDLDASKLAGIRPHTYAKRSLANFLDDRLGLAVYDPSAFSSKTKKGQGKTLRKSKLDFCHRALAAGEAWRFEDLSPEAQAFVAGLAELIAKSPLDP
jgi:hypothetical protein